MLVDVEVWCRLPVRAGQSGEADDEVERLGGLIVALEFLDQLPAVIPGAPGRLAQQHQPCNVLGTGLGFRQEKGEVKR